MESIVLTEIKRDLLAEGLKEGTPAFEREYRRRRVELCKEMRGVASCYNCAYFDYCELIKQHLRDMHGVSDG